MIRDVSTLVVNMTLTPAIIITCAWVPIAHHLGVRAQRKRDQAIRDEYAAHVAAGHFPADDYKRHQII